jgi:hypothetical protein
MVAHLYENRQAAVLDNRVADIVVPLGVESLLAPFRVWWRPSCPVAL